MQLRAHLSSFSLSHCLNLLFCIYLGLGWSSCSKAEEEDGSATEVSNLPEFKFEDLEPPGAANSVDPNQAAVEQDKQELEALGDPFENPENWAWLNIHIFLEEEGEPHLDVVGANVEIFGKRANNDMGRTRAISDEEGRIRAYLRPGTEVRNVLVKNTLQTAPRFESVGQVIEAGEHVNLELGVRRAGVLTGKVIDELGEPLADAEIHAWFRERWDVEIDQVPEADIIVTSDENGEFVMAGFPQAPFTVQAYFEGLVNVRRLAGAIKYGEQVDGIELRMHPAYTFIGEIRNKRDNPVPNAVVVAGAKGRRQPKPWPGPVEYMGYVPERQLVVTTDQDGIFRLDEVPEGRVWNLSIDHRSYKKKFMQIRPGQRSAEIELEAGVILRGVVYDDAEEPLPKVEIRLRGVTDRRNATNDDGAFRYEGLSEDPDAAILFYHEGFAPQVLWPLSLEEKMEAVKVVLQKGQPLSGFVQDAAGEPIAGATLEAKGQFLDDPSQSEFYPTKSPEHVFGLNRLVTGATGDFHFKDLYAGDFEITVTGPDGGEPIVLTAPAGKTDLKITLP